MLADAISEITCAPNLSSRHLLADREILSVAGEEGNSSNLLGLGLTWSHGPRTPRADRHCPAYGRIKKEAQRRVSPES